MKNILFLFALLLGLAACTSAVTTPTSTAVLATETPTSLPTNTPTPTDTQTLTETPSPLEIPTPTVMDISKYTEVPPSVDQFPVGQKTDIPNIIAALHDGPSLLSANAKPVTPSPMVNESNGNRHFGVSCNYNGMINCAPAAFIQYVDTLHGTPYTVDIVILELKTNNEDNRGYIAEYIYGNDIPWKLRFDHWSKNPNDPFDIIINVAMSQTYQATYPYFYSLTQQVGLLEAINTWITKGIISSDLEHMILL
jgi:hypothetical protein